MAAEIPKATIKCNDYQNDNDLIKYYDEWANTYDKDVNEERGYVGPEVGAKTLHEFLEQNNIDRDCRILDVGSGTGLVGEHLQKLNYTNIDGLEPSKGSNDVARIKNIYNNIIEEFIILGRETSILSNHYDAAIAIGVFTKGHFLEENNVMEEMIRAVKPDGLVCFCIREDIMFNEEYFHEQKMENLCKSNAWKLLLKAKKPYHLAGNCESCYMFVYQIL